MLCVTIKKGVPCAFMTAKGCNFNGGQCHPIVDPCQGCSKTLEVDSSTFCAVAPNPAQKWAKGSCNFATHVSRQVAEQTQKINPLKASKRAASGK
jgi:hypothetical protein